MLLLLLRRWCKEQDIRYLRTCTRYVVEALNNVDLCVLYSLTCLASYKYLGMVSCGIFHVIQSILSTTGTGILFCRIILQKAGVQRRHLGMSFLIPQANRIHLIPPHTHRRSIQSVSLAPYHRHLHAQADCIYMA